MHPSAERLLLSARLLRGAETPTAVAKLLNVSPQNVNRWKKDGVSQGGAIEAQRIYGVRADWIRSGDGEMAVGPSVAGVAQPASQFEISMTPPQIAWEGLMNTFDLPPEFRTAAPDDAMAPRLRAGQGLTLDTRLAPRAGDCVLVRDRTGGMHLRAYAPGVGRWEGKAENPAYPTLESERDGLTVVAVLTEQAGRWG